MTSPSNIPDAATEAALNTIIGGNEATGPDIALDLLSRGQIRLLLEAAAPHLMAQAWAQGARAAFDVTREGFNGEYAAEYLADDDYPPTNPYSGQPWRIDSDDEAPRG